MIFLIPLLAAPCAALAQPGGFMLEVTLEQGTVEGRPLRWSEREISLLARDGQLVSFPPQAVHDFRQSAPRFVGYAPDVQRARLLAEFGGAFDVSTTSHYLVVHPRGQKDVWAARFEELYRSFSRYFQVRGLTPQRPEFPLVAVVFGTRDDYFRYCQSLGQEMPPEYLGHYWNVSNRVYLFDAAEPGRDGSQNAATVIHEAAHQVAFNTGVHGRFAGTPRWLSEGLAMMFEAPGVHAAKPYHTQKDRIHPGQLAAFRQSLSRRPADALLSLLASDRRFEDDPRDAYAEAWALSFYLAETQPQQYTQYLRRTAARPDFQRYTPPQRLADFAAVFGSDWNVLDAKFLRYLSQL